MNGGRVSVKKKEKSKANNSFMLVTVQLFNRMMLSVSWEMGQKWVVQDDRTVKFDYYHLQIPTYRTE